MAIHANPVNKGNSTLSPTRFSSDFERCGPEPNGEKSFTMDSSLHYWVVNLLICKFARIHRYTPIINITIPITATARRNSFCYALCSKDKATAVKRNL